MLFAWCLQVIILATLNNMWPISLNILCLMQFVHLLVIIFVNIGIWIWIQFCLEKIWWNIEEIGAILLKVLFVHLILVMKIIGITYVHDIRIVTEFCLKKLNEYWRNSCNFVEIMSFKIKQSGLYYHSPLINAFN